MVPAGQSMHGPLVSGTRLTDGWPESVNMELKRPSGEGVVGTLHMFQTVTFSTKAVAP